MGAMLLSIGNVRSTTRLNFNCTGAWAKATDAVPNARESTTSIRAFIMIGLPTVLATCALSISCLRRSPTAPFYAMRWTLSPDTGRHRSAVRDGSIATERGCPRDVLFTPDSDQIADIV